MFPLQIPIDPTELQPDPDPWSLGNASLAQLKRFAKKGLYFSVYNLYLLSLTLGLSLNIMIGPNEQKLVDTELNRRKGRQEEGEEKEKDKEEKEKEGTYEIGSFEGYDAELRASIPELTDSQRELLCLKVNCCDYSYYSYYDY